jgi:hypothetical protein
MNRKAITVVGASVVVLLGVALTAGAIATGAPRHVRATVADTPPPVLHLPLPGKPGFPPKLDGPGTASQELLPDLVSLFPGIPTAPDAPGFPAVRALTVGGATHYVLVFDSGFHNAGPGPVLIWGHRASTATRDMTADQYIKLKTGSYALRRKVGALRYIFPFGTGLGMPHLHFHYVGAEVYALYPAGHFGRFRSQQKQGFCMNEPNTVFTDYCGYKDPTELSQIEGMYKGTSDFYGALVEGQEISLSGLAAGKYVLLNWLNSRCLLKERTYADNAASTGFTLTYPQGPSGAPVVTVGAELNGVPHTPCPAPAMTAAQARSYLQNAVVKESGGSVAGLRFRCSRATGTGFSCNANWRRGAVAYAGRFQIAHVASSKLARYATALAGISARARFDGRRSGHPLQGSESMPLLPSVKRADM